MYIRIGDEEYATSKKHQCVLRKRDDRTWVSLKAEDLANVRKDARAEVTRLILFLEEADRYIE